MFVYCFEGALILQSMANTEMIVAITLICIGVFYVMERLLGLSAMLFSWYYGEIVNDVENSEPNEEIQVRINNVTFFNFR